ncbi:coenzyme F420-0:L-glutamate ligase [Sphingomonas jatrophae]|uniref:Coenzyme F420-0:L-glutamate ligase / coenzyme F420-1:gamma-L-glutamate ligase n=1 Tax=Sphingomonas jatrophae TaxID=1166337 RepID=A0A1I6KEV8_9SPHN|nr:coenzyme F420-0:L-glutamate ligase [Sphingomonas jatrophae]SFR89684.1 coenzyme F420-0:L-glutamate ligase / coenzyme F420-1:gamma-L-glutamate ligase [Sphingomonas jatrophae]
MIGIFPLAAIDEVRPGDDLPALLTAALAAAGLVPAEGDVLVVTSKIVSKAEGRFVDLASVTPGEQARELAAVTRKDPRLVELVLAESQNVVRAVPHVLITRHRSGHVMANAGIDRSNLGGGDGEQALLLPLDADASAAALHVALAQRHAVPPAIVISDSFGRPWRYGVVNVAIGVAGLPALIDRRGELDRDGRLLEVTQVAMGDMIATAAGLATGEGAEGVPAALVRGVALPEEHRPAADLVRPLAEDLFR